MGLLDDAKNLAAKADGAVDKAKDLVEEHGDKIPGGLGDKAKDLVDKASAITDKIPGQG